MSINLIKRYREREGRLAVTCASHPFATSGGNPAKADCVVNCALAKVHRSFLPSFLRVAPITWPRNCAKESSRWTNGKRPSTFSHAISPSRLIDVYIEGGSPSDLYLELLRFIEEIYFAFLITLVEPWLCLNCCFFLREGKDWWKVKLTNKSSKGINWCSDSLEIFW